MRVGPSWVLAVVAAVTVPLVSPAAGNPAGTAAVTLTASVKSARVGATVTLTARAIIPRQISVRITAVRKGEKTVRTAARCAKAPCVARWKETAARTVAFQANLVLGGATIARSRIVVVTWTRPPPPPSNPPAPPGPGVPGDYVGPTSQTGKTLGFTVSSDGKRITALVIDFKSSCNSGEDYFDRATATPDVPVNADKTFTYHLSQSGMQLQIDGKFDSIDGTTATGTFEIHSQHNGSECDTGTVTWNAKKS